MATPTEKIALRAHMKKVRSSIAASDRLVQTQKITEKVMGLSAMKKIMREHGLIALFSPLGSEINILDIIPALAEAKVSLCVPVVVNADNIEFVLVNADHLLAPPDQQPDFLNKPAKRADLAGFTVVTPTDIDIFIMPGLAFDERGNRLGYGAGYYDKYLEHAGHATTIAPIFEEQLIETVPSDPHDIPIDYIVTPSKIITPAVV